MNDIKFRAQRWTLEDSGQRVIVENAWSWNGDCQERVRLNGDVLMEGGVPSLLKTWTEVARTPWPGEAEPLVIEWRSGLLSIKARARIGERILPWSDYHVAKWTGPRGQWPD